MHCTSSAQRSQRAPKVDNVAIVNGRRETELGIEANDNDNNNNNNNKRFSSASNETVIAARAQDTFAGESNESNEPTGASASTLIGGDGCANKGTNKPNQSPGRVKSLLAALISGANTANPFKSSSSLSSSTAAALKQTCHKCNGFDRSAANNVKLINEHHNDNGEQPKSNHNDIGGFDLDEGEEANNCQRRSSRNPMSHGSLVSAARNYLTAGLMRPFSSSSSSTDAGRLSRSAPATPLKRADKAPNGCALSARDAGPRARTAQGGAASAAEASANNNVQRPSVRFADTSVLQFSDRAVQTTATCGDSDDDDYEQVDDDDVVAANDAVDGLDDDDGDDDDGDDEDVDAAGARLVARLFKMPAGGTDCVSNADEQQQQKGGPNSTLAGESPMDSKRFRAHGYRLIDYISHYLDTIRDRRVTPLNIEPGYLKQRLDESAPVQGEPFAGIMRDFERHIMCGITHWQHPHFHAYFPAGNAYASILADMLSDALGCVGFSWAASPAYTELEIIMLNWMGKMIGLPDEFLCSASSSRGGGVIQGSASECVLVNLLAARHWAMEKLRKKYPNCEDGILLCKLIGYCSKEAHSCVEKAAMIGFIRMRALETDEKNSLRGETLEQAIKSDLEAGLEPFIVCATLGTTSCVSFDNLDELGQVCQKYDDIWLHVDAAYAGSALICPEFKYLMKGIERASSFNMNPNKWMLINFDCSLMWVKDRFKLTRAFVVDPLYLQHSFSDQAIDYRHWGIPLSRRFRALKLWFVIRNYGVNGLQEYIRNHVRLAKKFEQYIRSDPRFSITNEVVLGLVCFRLIGSNALNQRLLSMINASGKLHMVPASVQGRYVIRFCVCDQNAKDSDIYYAYKCIADFATELFESIRSGRERIRAISQQNTIDVSSISLHTQQSASADLINNLDGSNSANTCQTNDHQTTTSSNNNIILSERLSDKTQQVNAPACNELNVCHRSSRSPLTKQASVMQQQQQQQAAAGNSGSLAGAEACLPAALPLDSLASIDGCDYDLELDDDDDDVDVDDEDLDELDFDERSPANTADGSRTEAGSASTPTRERRGVTGSVSLDVRAARPLSQQHRTPSPRSCAQQRTAAHRVRSMTTSGGQSAPGASASGPTDAEAADELADRPAGISQRRQKMSVRYKREFFVRVVSDPRVYRASISGDINAHATSSSSLSGSGGTVLAATGSNQQQQQQQHQASTGAPQASSNNNN